MSQENVEIVRRAFARSKAAISIDCAAW